MSRVRQDCDHYIKLLLIGDSGVGKTCLLLQFSDNTFASSFITTIGIDFKIKNLHIDNKSVQLQIWDAAGQERFRTITSGYYRNANGVLLVYDVCDEGSFKNVRNWMQNIDEHALENVNKVTPDPMMDVCVRNEMGQMLIGNKSDIQEKRVISYADGQALAREFGIPFVESSAKTGENVAEIFDQMTRSVVKRMEEEKKPDRSAMSMSNIIGSEQMSSFASVRHNKRDGSCC